MESTYYQIFVREFPTYADLSFYQSRDRKFKTLEEAKEIASTWKKNLNLSVSIFRITCEEVE